MYVDVTYKDQHYILFKDLFDDIKSEKPFRYVFAAIEDGLDTDNMEEVTDEDIEKQHDKEI